MAELKTKASGASVSRFIASLEDPARREDCQTILEIMKKATGAEPRMWGSSIVGFGKYHYRYESGREGDWFVTGFSPRKQNLTLYLMSGLETHATLLRKLGKHKTGKGCLYINRLSDVDMRTLRELIARSVNGKLMGQTDR
jgi:Domain of unknown function (DU1801)